MFEPLVRELEVDGAVALVDLPDAGASPDSLSLDPDECVRDVRAVIEHLAPAQVTLVGLSFGAWVAARLAGLGAPANLARLVLIGGLPHATEELAQTYSTLAADLEAERLPLPALWEGLVAGCFPSGLPAETRRLVDAMLARIGRARAVRTLRRVAALARDELRVQPYDVPTLVVHARGDAVTPLTQGEALAALGRRARLEVVETDEHLVPLTQAAACAAAIHASR